MALVPSLANVLTDGIDSWKIKDTTDADDAYYSIPYLRNGKVKIASLAGNDKLLQPVSFGYLLTAEAEFLPIRTSANFIKLLPLFSTKLIDHKIALIGGSRIISSGPTTSTPSPTGFGAVKWKLTSDKDMDGEMSIVLSVQRRLTKAEYTQILTSANTPADGTADAGDALYNLLSLAIGDVAPAGIAKLELGAAAAGTYADDIDNFRKAVFTAELMPGFDGRGQYIGGVVQIDFSVESLETTETELLKWDDIAFRANESRLTFANGLVCTLPNTANNGLGIKTEITIDKDMDDNSFLKVSGSGRILTSAWSAIWGA
jgi:hypothetical protein